MERLPTELVALICSLSDFRSLKKIRLVNSRFAQAAAQYLFQGLCFALIPEYLDKVTEVAFHPTLRFYVRNSYFDYSVLDESFADYKTWQAEVNSPGNLTGGEKTEPELTLEQLRAAGWNCLQGDLDRCHTNFCRLLASQKALFDGRMDLAILSTALAMMPNLQSIEPIEEWCCDRDFLSSTPFSAITSDEDQWEPILSEVQRDTLLGEPFADHAFSTQLGLIRPLATLLSSLGLTRKPVLTLDITSIAWSFWEDNGPSGFSLDAQQLILTAFRHLEYLTVVFGIDDGDLVARLQGLLPLSLTTFLKAAPRLRQLDVEFDYYGPDDTETTFGDPNWQAGVFPHMGQLFPTLTLPTLTSIRLSHSE